MSLKIPEKKIIAVLPAYHAVKTLAQTIDAIPKEWIDEIILVDDASTDSTADLARSLGITTIVHQKNIGYGGNQKTCYSVALAHEADIAVMVHPDFQYDPKFIPELIRAVHYDGADAAFGSRMMTWGGALKGGMPLWKYAANIFLTGIENAVLGLALTEYHSGFRAYTREVLETLPLEKNSDGFAFDSEIIVQLRLAGFRIKEIPITTRYFKEASMIGFWKSVGYGISILKLMCAFLFHVANRKNDARFQFGRFHCRVCGASDNFLKYVSNIIASEAARYRITENRLGRHGAIYYCRRCRSRFVGANDVPVRLDSHYRDQPLDERYLREERGRRKSFERVLDRIGRFQKSGKMIEVGSGPGFFLDVAVGRGWEIEGIEPSAEWARFARERFAARVHEAGFEKLNEFPAGIFDAVVALDVIEHLENPREFLRACRRALKPGGALALTTPRNDSMLAKILGRRWYAIVPDHLAYFSRQGVETAAAAAGFQITARYHFVRYFSLGYIWYRLKPYFFLGLSEDGSRGSGILLPLQLCDEFEIYLEKPKT